jgi:hypothetical protein
MSTNIKGVLLVEQPDSLTDNQLLTKSVFFTK